MKIVLTNALTKQYYDLELSKEKCFRFNLFSILFSKKRAHFRLCFLNCLYINLFLLPETYMSYHDFSDSFFIDTKDLGNA